MALLWSTSSIWDSHYTAWFSPSRYPDLHEIRTYAAIQSHLMGPHRIHAIHDYLSRSLRDAQIQVAKRTRRRTLTFARLVQ
ncbi:hypothetical protein BC938DRAFT_480961 [Jimgerdemannia flammicorona]|uniref:Uncharacterized protein n=1 Tax=Jimgerdemannia flammicorona TaxID=994334 RepID=A0A433QH97_9FUNG|nr:hypothetical protein BC938DRAFT_480961 [Jimgerdemannia flammicorona]